MEMAAHAHARAVGVFYMLCLTAVLAICCPDTREAASYKSTSMSLMDGIEGLAVDHSFFFVFRFFFFSFSSHFFWLQLDRDGYRTESFRPRTRW